MKGISAASPSRLSEAWRSLEEIGFLWGLGAGVLIGGLAGSIALYHEPRTLSLALGLAALAAAALLTFLGRPVVAPLPAMELVPAMAPAPFSRVEDIPGLVSMVVLPAGEFRMGSADDDDSAYDHERPQHPVRVDGFLMAETTVTRGLYRQVMGGGRPEWERGERDDRLPATHVTWGEALRFCNALSRRQGLRPCYRRVLMFWHWNRAADGYRLPTEAEWEYAVRAGTETRWSFGNNEADLGRHAWYDENSDGKVHPVAEKEPNPWGFYDLLGNVWEWCWDRYGGYRPEPADNPSGPAIGLGRVIRGGSAWVDPRYLRSARRGRLRAGYRGGGLGFRCVRVPGRQP